MKILVYGAGVLGCNLARNLFRAGKNVTLLARGKGTEEIKKNGLRIKDKFSPRVSLSRIPVTTELKPEAPYDVIFVVMRYTQLDTIMDTLRASRTKNIIFVGNNVRAEATAAALPEKNVLFVQSHVPAHAQLGWVLDCYTMFGELSRMTQFKDKSAKNADNINAGLFTYPALMAADILLYQADLVPVGGDQKQHVEICRDIATRFNGIYGDTFKLPDPYIPQVGARVMSLTSPEKKMSKSDKDPNGCVYMLEKPEDILRKFKKAVTDSEACVRFDPADKPGVSNLMQIYAVATGKSFETIEQEFAGHGYGDFKQAVGESVVELLRPIREETERLLADKSYLESVYRAGAEKAAYVANRTLNKVYKKVGFLPR